MSDTGLYRRICLQLGSLTLWWMGVVRRNIDFPDDDGVLFLDKSAQLKLEGATPSVWFQPTDITTELGFLAVASGGNWTLQVRNVNYGTVLLSPINVSEDTASNTLDLFSTSAAIKTQTLVSKRQSDGSTFRHAIRSFGGTAVDQDWNWDYFVGGAYWLSSYDGTDAAYHLKMDSSAGGVALIGFFGATPVNRPDAYTQTYATATRTVIAYTADDESASYTGIDNAQGGTPYATVADLNALRAAVENLRALAENTTKVANSLIDDQQELGLAG